MGRILLLSFYICLHYTTVAGSTVVKINSLDLCDFIEIKGVVIWSRTISERCLDEVDDSGITLKHRYTM